MSPYLHSPWLPFCPPAGQGAARTRRLLGHLYVSPSFSLRSAPMPRPEKWPASTAVAEVCVSIKKGLFMWQKQRISQIKRLGTRIPEPPPGSNGETPTRVRAACGEDSGKGARHTAQAPSCCAAHTPQQLSGTTLPAATQETGPLRSPTPSDLGPDFSPRAHPPRRSAAWGHKIRWRRQMGRAKAYATGCILEKRAGERGVQGVTPWLRDPRVLGYQR